MTVELIVGGMRNIKDHRQGNLGRYLPGTILKYPEVDAQGIKMNDYDR